MEDLDDEREVDILLLGDAETGKSTFFNRLVLSDANPKNPLKDSAQPYVLTLKSSRQGTHRLCFSDTASPTNYLLHRPKLIIVAFDISRVSTLRSARYHWKRVIDSTYNLNERLPVLLLGLKRDLRTREENPTPEEEEAYARREAVVERTVMPQEAIRYAQEMRCDRYAECSAATGECWDVCVKDVMGMAVRSLRPDGGRTLGTQCVIL